MKTCIVEGCNNSVFTHSYCKHHSYLYYNSNCDKVVKNSTKYSPIPKQSLRRIEQNKLYFSLVEEMRNDAVKNDTFRCIFCGEKLTLEDNDPHHTNGRDGEMLLARRYLKFAHRLHHSMYHFWPIAKLIKESWWEGFLIRLKEIDERLYDKEINKLSK